MIFRLLDSKYLPIARSVLGRKLTSAWLLNKGAHPRDFGEKRFVDSYKTHLTLVIENARKEAKSLPTYCEEDEAMLSQFEHFQNDILTRAVDSSRSILKVCFMLRFFSSFDHILFPVAVHTADQCY